MPRRLIKWASRYIGNRGVVLFTLGLMWFVYGIGVLRDEAVTDLPEDWFPYQVRGGWWLVTGLLAMACAVKPHRRNGELRDDATAWGLLMIPVAIRWFAFLITWIMDIVNAGRWQDYPHPWRGVIIFTAFIVLIDRCAAGLDRLPPVPPPVPRTNGH